MSTTTRETECPLASAALAGDRAAFGVLVSQHRPLVLALCQRMLGDRDAAEDAVQDAILQALIHLSGLRSPAQFGPWLAGIGLNICRRRLRQRTRDAWSYEAALGGRWVSEPLDWRDGPEELAEAADLAARVRRAVAGLPAGQRAAVLLVYLAGLTQAEAAQTLGVTPAAVKARVHYARATLRHRLADVWEEQPMTTDSAERFIDVRIADVRRRPAEGDKPRPYAVILEEVGGSRSLPIWIGQFEGESLALQLKQVTPPRPLTFAFAARLITALGGTLQEVRITTLEADTFYATALVAGAAGVQPIDARPSDALNLALAAGARVTVAEAVLARVAAAFQAQLARRAEGDAWRSQLSDDADSIVAELTQRLSPLSSPSREERGPESDTIQTSPQ